MSVSQPYSAFDCLPHELMTAKLKAYGLSDEAVSLLENYLNGRMQQVRVGSHKSSWKQLSKGVPQGSILGLLLLNIFISDIFYFILKSVLYNYADDNTLSYIHRDLEILKSVLEDKSIILIKWFEENYMQANPDKFQAICVGKKASVSFEIVGNSIKCESNVTLLGINTVNSRYLEFQGTH